jgi:hypothetical protein
MESFYSLSHLQNSTNVVRDHTCFHNEVLKTHSSIVERKENIILNLKY